MRLAVALLALALPAAAAPPAAPPPTETRPVTDVLHGESIVDPYRWLEGDAKGALTPEVNAWTDAQLAYTRQVLDNLPGRKAVEDRLRELMEVGAITAPRMRGNRYFYGKREGNENQARVFMREGLSGAPKLLLDPNTLDAKGLVTVSWTSPDPAGKLLAFGMYRAGDENSTLYVLDVDSGRWLADEIPGKVGGVDWLPDSTGFFYRNLENVKDPYSGQVMFHRLGTHPRQDVRLFRQYTKEENAKLATTYGPGFSISEDGRWGFLGYATGTSTNDLWAVDLDRWKRTGEFVRTDVLVGSESTSRGTSLGDTLFLHTTDGAKNGRVVAVDLNAPARAGWKTLVPERKDVSIRGVSLARGILVVNLLKDAATRIELYALDGKPLGELPLPGIGTAYLSTSQDRTEAFLTFTSFNEPSGVYRVDLATKKLELWERPKVPVDPSLVEVKQVFYPSKDGTKVPMFVIHKKGLKLDGSNPTLLYAYGGFNVSQTPSFSATLFPWFEAGGVYALAGLRGGGEYGDAWHEAGMLERKQNVYDDFIAAAEWLIAQKYTKPAKLAVSGGSNGGLLTGAVLTQRPELFGAVISAVPLLDMLRYQSFLMARYWIPEYGTAENPEHFRFLKAYSPYHNVKKGTKYPAVLLTAGENDSRVHPLHARKMAALLQASTASDPATKPVLLWVDREAGHGQGKPLALRVRDVADQRMFLMWQLGMLK
ncbi:MAG TPA: prolyl oligopeptidase family serine peptidase [Thermoanaerobaculia bacterium]|nr:prolyl oligopeptidase family serine peptidase [Thermoanaerobaculia bacterium]HQP84643.1 prolyl oligopeptidase family serine peptidase [Thermoanaerobaculia bacterium]